MTIILDLDDVLANLRESLYQTLTEATGIDFHWRFWTHYDLRQHYPVVKDCLEDILIHGRTLEGCQPEPGAVAATWAINKLGVEIVIVTARGWHPQAEAITCDWLNAYNIYYDHLTVVPLGGNKLEVLTPFRNITLAVDDHPSHVTRYQAVGIPSLLMDRPWNNDFQAERIYSLEAVVERASAEAKSYSVSSRR